MSCNQPSEYCECNACASERAVHGAQKTPIGTIDLTPSWVAIGTVYLEVMMDSSAGSGAKAAARSEIMRALALADLYVKEHKR